MVRTMCATTVVASLLLPVSSTEGPSIGASRSCQWHVTDQTITVEAPVIYDIDVGTHCPRAGYGKLHDEVCEKCEGMDNKCGGEFVACAGCCQSPKTARYHSCTHIREYFFEKNSAKLDCDDRIDLSNGDVNIEYGLDTSQRSPNSGTLTEGCDAAVETKNPPDADGHHEVPVKLKFDCTGCAVKGVPFLLKQCCDHAEEFANSDMVKQFQDQGATVFLWADGCNQKWIGEQPQVEFPYAYAELAEATINTRMTAFVDEHYCSKSRTKESDTCPSSRRLLRQDRELLNSTRSLGGLDDCRWLSQEVEEEPTGPGEEKEAADAAAGLGSPLAAMLVGGGIACFSL